MKYIMLLMLTLFSQIAFGQAKQKSVLEAPKIFNDLLLENNVWGKKVLIGNSSKGRPIYAYYYNKGGVDKAMIIAGVHGSEFYGVDVANRLKDSLNRLKSPKSKWKILLIPELFPDNVLKGRDSSFKENYGRRTCEICHGLDKEPECTKCVDPNRQMPKINSYFKIGDTLSCVGDKIELENQYLIYITQKFDPSRIISLHCKNSYKMSEIGIYADPRTDNDNLALGYSDDAILVLRMAFVIKENNGIIYGNFVDEKYTKVKDEFKVKAVSYLNPVYPQDPPAESKGEKQDRSYEKKGGDGKISFGTWASTEIKNGQKRLKKAATTITVELPQYYYFFKKIDDKKELQTSRLEQNTLAYLKAIKEIFLEIK